MTRSPLEDAAALRDELMGWLIGSALPLWHAHGLDRTGGGFHETVGLDLAIAPVPRRTRVIARQIYCFARAPKLGWTGAWAEAVEVGLAYYFDRVVTPEGRVRTVIEADGRPKDDRFSLYDHAFALFAYAAAAEALPARRRDIEARAVALRDMLVATVKHPERGFEEDSPRRLPLKANPHMHLFEACLAWEAIGGDAVWTSLADEIAQLALDRFVDRETGWLREFFDADWRPMPGVEGRITEPGHHFEWAWLFVRWGLSRRGTDAIDVARRLAALAEAHGVDARRGVALNALLDDGSIRDGSARLWPQTERIKGHAALALASADPATRDRHLRLVAEAVRGLQGYLDVETPGLWRDRMGADGAYRVEPAPASTFYHIVCAVEELDKAIRALEAGAGAPDAA